MSFVDQSEPTSTGEGIGLQLGNAPSPRMSCSTFFLAGWEAPPAAPGNPLTSPVVPTPG
ncbi:hypothetical protein BD779DRAFT_1017954 [Infundibulicybe gibba]|nr:hypothetical protein BD779DRAFT_1017954 [Infundibulicybe gibba]